MDISELKEKIIPPVEGAGYEVVEIKFEKQFGTDTLTVFIYKKGGVDLTDCEKVNEVLDPILDECDFCPEGYNFNVSSPGLDRPIVSQDDFRRNLDEDVEIVFKKPIGKIKSAHGILVEYDDETITLEQKNGPHKFIIEDASVIRPYIKF